MIYNLKRQKEDPRDFLLASKPAPKRVLRRKVDHSDECVPIFDQGQLGSCSANAGCTGIAHVLKDNNLILSRLYAYYKEREKEGTINEDSGAQMRDICKIAVSGVCKEEFFPYIIEDFANAPTADAIADAPKHKASTFHAARTINDIKEGIDLHDALVLMGMEVFESFESEEVARTGIVPLPKAGEKNLGGHAVIIVGYDDDKQMFKVRNSWGKEWGDKGHFYLPYDYVIKGYAFDFWVLG